MQGEKVWLMLLMDFILYWNHVRPDIPVSWSDISFKILELFFKLSAMFPYDDLELRTSSGIAFLLWELLCSGLYPSPTLAGLPTLCHYVVWGKIVWLPHLCLGNIWKLCKGLTETSVIISQFNCPILLPSSL